MFLERARGTGRVLIAEGGNLYALEILGIFGRWLWFDRCTISCGGIFLVGNIKSDMLNVRCTLEH